MSNYDFTKIVHLKPMERSFTRHFTAYTLLIALLFANFGSFVLFQFANNENRREICIRIEEGDVDGFIMLDIPINELSNPTVFTQENSDEIVYKNHLYDVLKKETKKQSTVFYCINDTKEEILNSELNIHTTSLFHAIPSGKAAAKTFSKNVLKDYVRGIRIHFNSLNANTNFSLKQHIESSYMDVWQDKYIPPPLVA